MFHEDGEVGWAREYALGDASLPSTVVDRRGHWSKLLPRALSYFLWLKRWIHHPLNT